ncbi:serine/threonine protein phosphatase [Nitratiruptor sp. YY09-18]|nr:serine/threonine protein phosphatase [Nitratiruptor sp. YY09-18]
MQLRQKIGIQKGDIEISVGDFLNKGPYSIKVLQFLRKNSILAVRGNHEDKFIRYHFHQILHPKKNPMRLDTLEEQIYAQLSDEDIRYLQTLPLFIQKKKLTVVHAGVLPQTKLENLDKKMAAKIMRVRYVDDEGHFVPLDKVDIQRHFWWSDLYDGRYGFIVYGHQPFYAPRLDRFSIGIDTGGVYGNKLTAAIFGECIAQMEIVQVASKAYAQRRRPWIVADL